MSIPKSVQPIPVFPEYVMFVTVEFEAVESILIRKACWLSIILIKYINEPILKEEWSYLLITVFCEMTIPETLTLLLMEPYSKSRKQIYEIFHNDSR